QGRWRARWPQDAPRRRRRSALQLSLTATRAEDEVIVGKGRCRAHGVLLDEQTGVDHGDESTGTKKAPHRSSCPVRDFLFGAPRGIRTPTLLIRSQMLYPLS